MKYLKKILEWRKKILNRFDTTLYLITDSTGLAENEFLEKVEMGVKGGVTLVQLREKDKTTREYITLAKKIHEITKEYKIPLIIDDRVDVAQAVGAEGVHLGVCDMTVEDARRILGDKMIIGATAKTVEQATDAWRQGADYLGVGAIYPTTTKVKTIITSVQTLSDICRAVPIPVNAIGGLNKDNINILKGIDISGICVVSAIMKAENPEREAVILRSKAEELIK